MNLYAYVENNPISEIDPLGLRDYWDRAAQFSRGVSSTAGSIVVFAGVAVAEGATFGGATPVAAFGAVGGVGLLTYGMGNMVAAFSNDDKSANTMLNSPSSAPQLIARGIGGQKAQDQVAVVEAIYGMGASNSLLEGASATLGYIDSLQALSGDTQPNATSLYGVSSSVQAFAPAALFPPGYNPFSLIQRPNCP
jgi:hypothetical protein